MWDCCFCIDTCPFLYRRLRCLFYGLLQPPFNRLGSRRLRRLFYGLLQPPPDWLTSRRLRRLVSDLQDSGLEPSPWFLIVGVSATGVSCATCSTPVLNHRLGFLSVGVSAMGVSSATCSTPVLNRRLGFLSVDEAATGVSCATCRTPVLKRRHLVPSGIHLATGVSSNMLFLNLGFALYTDIGSGTGVYCATCITTVALGSYRQVYPQQASRPICLS